MTMSGKPPGNQRGSTWARRTHNDFPAVDVCQLHCGRHGGTRRPFPQYIGPRTDFDLIIVGSGMGGGVLADDLAERVGGSKRILVLEAGSFVYPTHVYNVSRFPNASLAKHFGCDTFWQAGNSGTQNYIGEKPQLNLGGRSIFWSGLIPTVQGWELDYFPSRVRHDLTAG